MDGIPMVCATRRLTWFYDIGDDGPASQIDYYKICIGVGLVPEFEVLYVSILGPPSVRHKGLFDFRFARS